MPPLVDVGGGHLAACRRYEILEPLDVHDVRALAEDETESLIP